MSSATSTAIATRRARSVPCSTAAALAATSALVLSACAPPAGGSDAEATATSAAGAPERIVAVSSETADMALLLAGPDRVAAVGESSQSPHMGMVPDLAAEVADTLPSGVEPDAEQILSYSPDLVLTTARHAGERSVSEQLDESGVPSLVFESDAFTTPEAYADALLRMGEALGEEDSASRHADELLGEIRAVDEDVSAAAGHTGGASDTTAGGSRADAGEAPRILALMARGGTVMAMDGELMLPGLAVRAGAVDAAAEAGLTSTSPLDAELLVRADPDIILVEDFMGAGEAPFDGLLGGDAVAAVPAIAEDEVHVVPMTKASAVAGIHLPEGYREVADIVSGT